MQGTRALSAHVIMARKGVKSRLLGYFLLTIAEIPPERRLTRTQAVLEVGDRTSIEQKGRGFATGVWND